MTGQPDLARGARFYSGALTGEKLSMPPATPHPRNGLDYKKTQLFVRHYPENNCNLYAFYPFNVYTVYTQSNQLTSGDVKLTSRANVRMF